MTARYHSLQHRLVLAFASFALLTVLLFGFLAVLFAYTVEDSFFERMLEDEAQHQLDALARTGTTAAPKRELIRIYQGITDLPADLRQQLLPNENRHEFAGSDGRHYHLRRLAVVGRDAPLLLVAEVSQYLVVRPVLADMLWFLAKAAIILLLVIGVAGYGLARRATAPLTALARQVADTEPGNLAQPFAATYPNNEIGLLARHLEATLQRLNRFLQREQQFTRDASHELRTPIAVIQSSAELLQAQPLQDAARVLSQRIHSASVQMEQIVKLLLSLAREAAPAAEESVALLPLIETSVVQQAELLADKPVTVSVSVAATARVRGHATVLAIIIDNLIRNAFQYTAHGAITIDYHDNALQIRDSGRGIEPEVKARLGEPLCKGEHSSGFGIGLSLVARLCEHYGITLRIDDVSTGGTSVSLHWPDAI